MQRFLTLIVLAMFSAALVGCRGEVDVDDDNDLDRDSSYKKETTYKKTDDGTRTTKTETKIDR